jgi:hypothetical protein
MPHQAETTITQTRARCRHIHATGNQCGSPALRNEIFCYYHHTTRRPKPGSGKLRYLDATEPFHLPVIEDRASALAAASCLLSRLASNDLDILRAGRMIYTLQVLTAFLPAEPPVASASPEAETNPIPHPAPCLDIDRVAEIVDHETHGLIAPESSSSPSPQPAESITIQASAPRRTPPRLSPSSCLIL